MTIFEAIGLVGITLILVRGSIFTVPRAYFHHRIQTGGKYAQRLLAFPNALLGCVQCSGFWVGILAWLVAVATGKMANGTAMEVVFSVFVYGGAISVLSLAVDLLLAFVNTWSKNKT